MGKRRGTMETMFRRGHSVITDRPIKTAAEAISRMRTQVREIAAGPYPRRLIPHS